MATPKDVVELFTLTDAEWSTVVNALRVAAERYIDHAQVIGATVSRVNDAGRTRFALAEQFLHQARDWRALAARIEEGVGV